ncbi:PAS-domain containing protein [Actibacterium ureilyticum]|uniref:PAS-domain containing protein n=1 Tax=Actibacterium ureilyticum TaxID=1590614 RepID=UPI000BAA9B66|nr:PAS-domain containing protein [Actibacterium ureilyticum]
MDWVFALTIVATSFLTALAALLGVSMTPAGIRLPWARRAQMQSDETVFLFDQGVLIDATPSARKLISQGPHDLDDWHRLNALLAPRFPDFADSMSKLAETGVAVIEELAGPAMIRARWLSGVARITLTEPDGREGLADIDTQSLAALNSELDVLRRVAANIPTLVWQQNAQGDVTWANRAYLRLAETTLREEESLIWPLPRLFASQDLPLPDQDRQPRRASIRIPDTGLQWFDCVALTEAEGRLFFALPADATVRAESSLQNFVQTLTKTFAGLHIGLAVFDRARRLVLFNPALTDLCTLEAEFLIARPTLFSFLDRLREKQMIPEPKDYKGWRKRMADLEAEAANGVFQETWTMPTGQTYRVTGQPHPDGAVAFLFEDITTEITLTRRFRAELEQNQAVIDSLDDAIAVFSPAGVMTLTNAAYVRMWGGDPTETLGNFTVTDACRVWAETCEPASAWREITTYATRMDKRTPKALRLYASNGALLTCRLKPVAGGGTLVAFGKAAVGDADPGLGRRLTLSAPQD